jgi:hypothetical protein
VNQLNSYSATMLEAADRGNTLRGSLGGYVLTVAPD